MTIRVLIADDQPLVRSGVRMILESQGDIEVVAEAADGAEAVASALGLRPDVALVDIRMPGMDGLEATRRLGAADPEHGTRVIILTTFGLDEYVFGALRAGASGFLLKDASPEQIVAAVRLAAAGDALLFPAATRRLIERFLGPAPSASGAGLAELTAREVEVLRFMARGLNNAELGELLHLSEGTVKTHVAHILLKLNVRDRVQAVIAAYEAGLVQPERS